MSEAASPSKADSRLGHTTGVVLCRAGEAGLSVGAHTLAERAAALLGEVCAEVVSVAAEGASDVVLLAAGLEAASGDHALVSSADRPLLTPDLLIGLAGLPDADAALPRDAQAVHSTCARYRRASVLPALRAAADAGITDPLQALADLEVCWLQGDSLASLDPDGSALARVADAAGLEALVERHAERARGPWPGHPGLGLLARSD